MRSGVAPDGLGGVSGVSVQRDALQNELVLDRLGAAALDAQHRMQTSRTTSHCANMNRPPPHSFMA